MKKPKCNLNLYCNFLLASTNNFTSTYLAAVSEQIKHDSVTRWLANTKLTPRILWEKVEPLVNKESGLLIIDDSLLSKSYSQKIKPVGRYYSGNLHRVTRGIPLVTLLWTGGEEYLPVDYRIANKKEDGLTKQQHFREMLLLAIHRGIKSKTVVFDGWYAGAENLKFIQKQGLIWVTWLRSNRIVDHGQHLEEKQIPKEGLVVHLKMVGFIKVFKRISKINGEVEYLATNDLELNLTDLETVTAQRWKIEQYHRGLKQTTGIEKCQARTPRSQRTHIFCSLLSFVALEVNRVKTGVSWYAQKRSLTDHIMRQILVKPVFSFSFG